MRFIIFLLVFCLIKTSVGVDPNNFKTCEQSSFCRRCRKVEPNKSPYALVSGSLNTYSDSVTAEITNKDNAHIFTFKLQVLEGNVFRVRIDEKTPLKDRYKVIDALKGHTKPGSLKVDESQSDLVVTSGQNKAIIHADPFRIDFYQNEKLTVSINAKGLMHFEHIRKKVQQPQGEQTDDDNNAADTAKNDKAINEDPGAWEENFKSHHDAKPYGPEAVALDFSFPQANVMFGIPEHADSFQLKSTEGGDPYRLYNLDVFEYELNSKMALYGSVPVLYGHGPERTAGVFWQNVAETWVDIYNPTNTKDLMSEVTKYISGKKSDPPTAHFMSESGIIDVFVLLGPSPLETFKQYTDLTGPTPLPQVFALGYHQSRWNYNDEQDVDTVNKKFDEHDIPLDTIWLDIEYTDGKKYFTWDSHKFPHPLDMIKNLTDIGRHLTIIIDPHIKRDNNYFVHNDCTDRGYYVKTNNGNDYEGWCWPGSTSYPDLFNPEVRKYFSDQYLLENFKTVTKDVMIWNDMNEPSVFNGPEVTMLKDNLHYGGWEHRDVHNLYAHMHIISTFEGLARRDPTQRPFILSRGHFSGTQRYAAIWTGDNKAEWGHLVASVSMCLSEAVAGFSFCGADVGGFFGNPDSELLERWYQAAAFQPFFRSHSHIDTKRREPWLFSEETRLIIRDALRKRYSYLPFWYTMFYEHERYGYPIMRPLLAHYPADKNTFDIDYEYLLQDKMLVSPIMEPGKTSGRAYFPAVEENKGDIWYDIDTYNAFDRPGHETFAADKFKIPAFQRGGSIIPKKERIRRASTLMKDDPYTLIVCLDRSGIAKGTLFIDDEKSYDYRKGSYLYIEFEYKNGVLKNKFIDKDATYPTRSWLERVVLIGLDDKKLPKSAKLKTTEKAEDLEVYKSGNSVVIRRPGIGMFDLFTITLKY